MSVHDKEPPIKDLYPYTVYQVETIAGQDHLKRPGGRCVRNCPACDYKDALSIANGHDGKLLLHCHVGCSFDDVARALGEPNVSPLAKAKSRRIRKNDPSATDRSEFIDRLVTRSIPALGTAASRYLSVRGISLAAPPDVHFLPKHRHAPSGLICPVMLALVRDVGGDVIGVHRTFLASNGEGTAKVIPSKMTLGRIGGGAVRLHRTGVDLAELAISEGIETGLSVAEATGFPVWAALSAGGIEKLVLPPLPNARQIMIFADHDHHCRGQRAAEHAAERFVAEGRSVRIVLPQKVCTDFNDVLREAG